MVHLLDPPPGEVLKARLLARGFRETRYNGAPAFAKEAEGVLLLALLDPPRFAAYSEEGPPRRAQRLLEAELQALLEGLPGALARGLDL